MEKTLENQIEAYKKYIDTHIENVQKCFQFYGKALCEKLGIDYVRLATNVEDHDQSKYSKEEFDGYRSYFYPTSEEEAEKANEGGYLKKKFDAAWLHHLRNNAHHPEFWINFNGETGYECNTMDKYAIAEMLLDWAAMGITKGDTAYEYFNKSVATKPFNKETVMIIDGIIEIFKEKYHD